MSGHDATASRTPRLAAEYLVISFVVIGVYIAARPPGGPVPPLVVAAATVAVYLRRQATFDRRDLFRAGAVGRALPGIVLISAAVSPALIAGVAVLPPTPAPRGARRAARRKHAGTECSDD